MPTVRIVLDTNVLVSALITRDTPPDQLYRAWLQGEFELLTSRAQIAELSAVLARPRLRPYINLQEADIISEHLDTRATIVRFPGPVTLSIDPADNAILAAAIAGGAELVVSGDRRHLLTLGEAEGIPIVSPKAALERLEDA